MVAADATALVADKIVAVIAAPENRPEWVDQQEYFRERNLVVNITAMKRLVQQEQLAANGFGAAPAIKFIAQKIQPHCVLVAVQMIENRLLSVKKIPVINI